MAPVATQTTSRPTTESTYNASLKANGHANADKYHAKSTDEAIESEHTHAAHNYHPLPIVFSRASGCSVWDPEGV